MLFNLYIGIDYSGSASPIDRPSNIAFYLTHLKNAPSPVFPCDFPFNNTTAKNWSRTDLARTLTNILNTKSSHRIVIGLDHGFSFPIDYFRRNLITSYPEFLSQYHTLWQQDQLDLNPDKNERRTQYKTRKQHRISHAGHPNEKRITEKRSGSAASVFDYENCQRNVAFSTHEGIPWLHQLRDNCPNLHFWPFDGFDISKTQKHVILEAYPALYKHKYKTNLKADARDANAIVKWLQEQDQNQQLATFFSPLLTKEEREIALLEGWILGVQ
ncbi:hypothetical protein KS4_07350 [Poriferisphaera corsica]|uniref:DUF429 domain-containing protein n=1 Tax=Poriferisphaera corsica TaxID=2528020 RepID=A0A517YR84_9BACT|nr:hypothetical protein [Poriferisphaera corsica]QDU32701.1 hypothetical protein KS4_07350 [Poriferisphaera corsica]